MEQDFRECLPDRGVSLKEGSELVSRKEHASVIHLVCGWIGTAGQFSIRSARLALHRVISAFRPGSGLMNSWV